ncbi:hypothetical protein GCM10009616_08090 [Microlunatus lacustris]
MRDTLAGSWPCQGSGDVTNGAKVEGCPNKPKGRLCWTHHRHKRLYGDPRAGRFSPKTHPAACSVEGCERPY